MAEGAMTHHIQDITSPSGISISISSSSEIYGSNEDAPSVCDTDAPPVVDSVVPKSRNSINNDNCCAVPMRTPLQWHFRGLTLWLEFEEFDSDLSNALAYFADKYGTSRIPRPHATTLYGMTHLTQQQARKKLHQVPNILKERKWPVMERPVCVKSDLSIEGLPGQVCSIAWSEFAFPTNEFHEEAMDRLHELFEFPHKPNQPWTPHISVAYDNPEDTVLNLPDFIELVAKTPTLVTMSRRIKAMPLWSTEGFISDWKCLDRIEFEA